MHILIQHVIQHSIYSISFLWRDNLRASNSSARCWFCSSMRSTCDLGIGHLFNAAQATPKLWEQRREIRLLATETHYIILQNELTADCRSCASAASQTKNTCKVEFTLTISCLHDHANLQLSDNQVLQGTLQNLSKFMTKIVCFVSRLHPKHHLHKTVRDQINSEEQWSIVDHS